jgi:hypothetical protein
MDDHTTSGEVSADFGYEKVDRYNTHAVGRIAASFHSILKEERTRAEFMRLIG